MRGVQRPHPRDDDRSSPAEPELAAVRPARRDADLRETAFFQGPCRPHQPRGVSVSRLIRTSRGAAPDGGGARLPKFHITAGSRGDPQPMGKIEPDEASCGTGKQQTRESRYGSSTTTSANASRTTSSWTCIRDPRRRPLRVNAFSSAVRVSAAFRLGPRTFRTLDSSGGPPVAARADRQTRGFALVTGRPAGAVDDDGGQ